MSVSNKELEARQEVLDDLDNYIGKCQEDITAMMDTLDWTPEHFMVPRKLSVCKYNSGHKMPISALDNHERTCQLRSQGYSKEDVEQILEDISYFYEDAECVHSVKLDKETLNSVLWKHHVENHSVFYGLERMPQIPVEEEQLLSREDRLGLAQYITSAAKEAKRLKVLEKSELLGGDNILDLMRKGDDNDTKLNPLEEIAALRDYRRRRQTYRAKNVHITKKSHTEVLREVITNQMEILEKSLQEDSNRITPDGSLQERINDKADNRDMRPPRSRSMSREIHRRNSSRSTNEAGRSGSRQGTETESSSRQRNETERSSRQRNDVESSSKQRKETESSSRQRNETKHSSRQRSETESSSKQRKETESSSRQRNETEHSSRQRSETESISRQRNDVESSSRQWNDTESNSRPRSETESSSRQISETERNLRQQNEGSDSFGQGNDPENSSRTYQRNVTESSSRQGEELERSDTKRDGFRSRSRSEDRKVRKRSASRDRSYSRSPSRSSDRHKKHKHKKHKKHKQKHKKSRYDDEDETTANKRKEDY